MIKKGGGVLCSTPEVKYEFVKTHVSSFSIKRMCNMFSIERSGYYAAWTKT